jgi:hypothetical protein
MPELIKQIFRICLLAAGPQDLPFSHTLLRLSLLLYLLSGLATMLPAAAPDMAILAMLADTAVLLLFGGLCLKGFNMPARFVQMSTALAATGSVFQLLAWPMLVYLDSLPKDTSSVSVSLLLLLVTGWNLAVYTHIFRESFNVRMLSAFVLTLCYAVIAVSVRQFFFPELGV